MPGRIFTIEGKIQEGEDPVIVAQIQDIDGNRLERGDIDGTDGSEITRNIYYESDGDPLTVVNTGTIDKDNVFENTSYNTGGRWNDLDKVGYNFSRQEPRANHTNRKGAGLYRFEYSWSTSSEGSMILVAFITVEESRTFAPA